MDAPLLLGIEFGGTKLQLALGRGDGHLLWTRRIAAQPQAGAQGIRRQVAEALSGLLGEAGEPIAAAGVGFGGPVDSERGTVTRSFQVVGWEDFPLADWVSQTTGISDVALHNDADTAALGEARFGAGAGLSPGLYINSGSGIGGGLVIDGRIYRGAGSGAMEIGHLRIEEGDDSGGRPKTLEQIASGWSIAAAGREWAMQSGGEWETEGLAHLCGRDPERITAATVAQSARAKPDGMSAVILRRATRAMGQALAHAVTLLAPRRVILGGGVSLIDDELWLDPIRRELNERVFPPFRGKFDVVSASLGEEVVLHGALALARDSLTGDI